MFYPPLTTAYGYFTSDKEFISHDNRRYQLINSFPKFVNCYINILNCNPQKIVSAVFTEHV